VIIQRSFLLRTLSRVVVAYVVAVAKVAMEGLRRAHGSFLNLLELLKEDFTGIHPGVNHILSHRVLIM
jgi:hypothetical protein